MLRLVVLLLVLMNGVYFAWSEGLLRAYGFAPAQQSEPQRLAQQLHPEAMQVLTGEDARRAEASPPAAPAVPAGPVVCLQAGLFDDKQSAFLRNALEPALPTGSWELRPEVEPARWIIYMGKFANAEATDRKRDELQTLKLKFEPLQNPALEPGLSLGSYPTQDAAKAALQQLSQRGVRTARVTQELEEVRGNRLVIPAADDTLRTRLEDFGTVLAGKPLRPCP